MSKVPPNIRPPTSEEIRELAAHHYIELTDEEVRDFKQLIATSLAGYERLDELSVPISEPKYTDRNPGYKPDADEDPLNAFIRKCEVAGADSGLLADYEVGLKDNVSVAGIELTCGSKLFDGYVPETDATIVTRLLDAGATISAKLNMADMAFSGSGGLSATGPVRNPHDPEYIAGGSSSGSAAAVVNGDVDVAIGGDQGGSIRIPAAWSGGVGHKPTHGLVPYTGIAGLGRSFDHTGPITRSVADAARVLEVIAGKDPKDPRQGHVPTSSYTDALDGAASDVTVGVLAEGFGHDQSESGVDSTVREALSAFEVAGADVEEVSIPMHLDGMPIWNGIATEGTMATVEAEGIGYNAGGAYDTQFMEAFAHARRAHGNDYLATVKLTLIMGQYLSEKYHSHYYAKAQNLSRELARRYDDALKNIDVLAMPTTPQTAHAHKDDLTRMEIIDRALNMLPNTAPFDATGHPALTVPAGTSDGLPVGLMLVGDQFDDQTVLQVGHVFEQVVDPSL